MVQASMRCRRNMQPAGLTLAAKGPSSNQKDELSLCAFVPVVELVEIGEERGELILRHLSYLRYSVQLDAQESDEPSCFSTTLMPEQ